MNCRGRSMEARLSAAGVEAGASPIEAWRRLRATEGPRATVIDLYELVAKPRGVAAHELSREERVALGRSVMPDVWPGFETTPGSERMSDTVQVVDWEPQWPVSFQRWRRQLQDCLGTVAQRIEHVGSTSVPGLPAKPIIDIQVSVADLDDEPRYGPALQNVGLQLRSRDALHRYFRPFPERPRDVHVHVCRTGSEWEREHLLFRDYLRKQPTACARYALVKRRAAATWADDGIAYTDAKSEIILDLIREAQH